jgi:hypothetical protein
MPFMESSKAYRHMFIRARTYQLDGWRSEFRICIPECEEGCLAIAMTHDVPGAFASEEEAIEGAFLHAPGVIEKHIMCILNDTPIPPEDELKRQLAERRLNLSKRIY